MTDKTKHWDALEAAAALLPDEAFVKSTFSGGTGNDCLEVAKVEGHGYVLRHSVRKDHIIPLTRSEYEAYVNGVRAGEPDLLP